MKAELTFILAAIAANGLRKVSAPVNEFSYRRFPVLNNHLPLKNAKGDKCSNANYSWRVFIYIFTYSPTIDGKNISSNWWLKNRNEIIMN